MSAENGAGMFNTIKGVNMTDEIQNTCSDCAVNGIGIGCYIPQKYEVICCDNPFCLILQCRIGDIDCATCLPQLCAPDAICGVNGKCAFCPICIDGCVMRDCDCDAICKKCPCPDCDPRCILCLKGCSLCCQERCADIDCSLCCPAAILPYCAMCGACAARDCGKCVDLCGWEGCGTFCAYKFDWCPAKCCCRNCGILCAFPACPKLHDCCNEMTAADKKYVFGATPPPLGGGLPTVRGPRGNPINFNGDDGPAKTSSAAVAPSS